jgi:hypothetical protein
VSTATPEPRWVDTVAIAHRGLATKIPTCAESCRFHDGKRCELLGFRPDNLCEPMIADWSEIIGRHAAHSRRVRRLHPNGAR